MNDTQSAPWLVALVALIALLLAGPGVSSAAAPPKAPEVPPDLPPQIEVLQPGVKLTLLAEQTALVTPTGIDVDAQGQIWVVSCHTHFRPQGYAGPAHDEIVVFDRNGKNRRVFYNHTDMTMNLKVGRDGWIYLAERSRILRVKDTNGDGVADVEENVAVLDTVTDYPHNGLAGLAWLPSGELIFSLGENFGKDWTLAGRDGAKLIGRGEGGVFRCRPDGGSLRRIARGFWNPFGLMARQDGELFAVDNDSHSRPPCRLLNIVEGADYGFQQVYGRAPVHPFVAWNGELRGTLGMIHPSGEGPCAIVELGGGALVPSWSNHRIDYFPLVRKGAGYTSEPVELLRGGEFFRPTCLAAGPDGAFYFTDWVFSSYALHGCGRLWKLEIDKAEATWLKPAPEPPNAAAQLAKNLRAGRAKLTEAELFAHARGSDPYLSDAALTALARASARWAPEHVRNLPARDRVWALLRELLAVNDSVLSLEVVRTLAARDPDDAHVVLAEVATDETRSAELRADAITGLAASSAPAHHALLLKLAAHDHATIRDEALRALRFSPLEDAVRKSLQHVAQRHPESVALVDALLDPASIDAGRPALDDTAAWLKRLADGCKGSIGEAR